MAAMINNKYIKMNETAVTAVAKALNLSVGMHLEIVEEDHGDLCECGKPAVASLECEGLVMHLCRDCLLNVLTKAHKELVEATKQISKIKEEVALK